ncbi:MAG: hypothetical protein PHD01_07550, partial [Geobacteraceae bacterium]|nr:hypothetical protein [Geobacteraceae bacterium]
MREIGRKLGIMLTTIAALALGSGTALAAGWTFTDLSVLGNITGDSYASAINNNGDIVGNAMYAGDDYSHATLWSGGVAYDLGTLGLESSASGINDAGVIVGTSRMDVSPRTRHAVLYSTSAPPVDILPDSAYPNADFSTARGINNSGQVVGQVHTDLYTMEALLWSDPTAPSTFQVLDTGGLPAYADSINNVGQVVGMIDVPFTEPNGYETYLHHAAFWDADGTLTDLSSFGGSGALAVGLNDLGQVLVQVSGATEVDGKSVTDQWSLVWQDGEAGERLAGLGGTRTAANAINNNGLIVGESQAADGSMHAVLWQDGEIIDLNDYL